MQKNKGEINIIGPKKELNAITFEKRGKAKPKQDKKNNKNVISISTKRQIIEQERRKIKEDTGKNTLTKQEKKKAHKKAKKRIAALKYPVLAVIILGAGVATYKNLPIIQENAKNIVDDFTKKNDMDKFKQAYKVSEEEKLKSKEQKELEAQINELQSESDVLAYIKNMYIEKYEQKTGDEKLTTEDIMIFCFLLGVFLSIKHLIRYIIAGIQASIIRMAATPIISRPMITFVPTPVEPFFFPPPPVDMLANVPPGPLKYFPNRTLII